MTLVLDSSYPISRASPPLKWIFPGTDSGSRTLLFLKIPCGVAGWTELSGCNSAILPCRPTCRVGHLTGAELGLWPRGPESLGKSFWFHPQEGAPRSSCQRSASKVILPGRRTETHYASDVYRFRSLGLPGQRQYRCWI